MHGHQHGKHESGHAHKQTHKGKTITEGHPRVDVQKKNPKEDFNKKDKEVPISKIQHQGPTNPKPPIKNDPALQKYRLDDNYYTQSVNFLSRFGQPVPSNIMAQMGEIGIMINPAMLNMLQPPQNPNQAA